MYGKKPGAPQRDPEKSGFRASVPCGEIFIYIVHQLTRRRYRGDGLAGAFATPRVLSPQSYRWFTSRLWHHLKLKTESETNQTWLMVALDAVARPTSSLGLRCGLPSWINRPDRIGPCLISFVVRFPFFPPHFLIQRYLPKGKLISTSWIQHVSVLRRHG